MILNITLSCRYFKSWEKAKMVLCFFCDMKGKNGSELTFFSTLGQIAPLIPAHIKTKYISTVFCVPPSLKLWVTEIILGIFLKMLEWIRDILSPITQFLTIVRFYSALGWFAQSCPWMKSAVLAFFSVACSCSHGNFAVDMWDNKLKAWFPSLNVWKINFSIIVWSNL